MSEKYVSILELDEYNIIFHESGVVTGFWFVLERIKLDYEEKARAQTESRGYKEQITKMNHLNMLFDVLVGRNVPIDALIVQYEVALVMQFICHHIMKNPKTGKPVIKVNIIREGHDEANELKPTATDIENLEKKAPQLVVVQPQKGS